jgi:hypothetical protein
MQTKYFRTSKKEYCHITDDTIFIFNSKEPNRIPLEHEVSNAWGILSVLNYILFFFLFAYVAISVNVYGFSFFKHVANYGGLFLLFISFMRIQRGLTSSNTPTIQRSKIKGIHFKTPPFSYPRLLIYFEGPEGKVLRRSISILYKREALPILKEVGFQI